MDPHFWQLIVKLHGIDVADAAKKIYEKCRADDWYIAAQDAMNVARFLLDPTRRTVPVE